MTAIKVKADLQTIHKTNIKGHIHTLELLCNYETGEYSFRYFVNDVESGTLGGITHNLDGEIDRFLGFMILSEKYIAYKWLPQLIEFCMDCKAKLR